MQLRVHGYHSGLVALAPTDTKGGPTRVQEQVPVFQGQRLAYPQAGPPLFQYQQLRHRVWPKAITASISTRSGYSGGLKIFSRGDCCNPALLGWIPWARRVLTAVVVMGQRETKWPILLHQPTALLPGRFSSSHAAAFSADPNVRSLPGGSWTHLRPGGFSSNTNHGARNWWSSNRPLASRPIAWQDPLAWMDAVRLPFGSHQPFGFDR